MRWTAARAVLQTEDGRMVVVWNGGPSACWGFVSVHFSGRGRQVARVRRGAPDPPSRTLRRRAVAPRGVRAGDRRAGPRRDVGLAYPALAWLGRLPEAPSSSTPSPARTGPRPPSTRGATESRAGYGAAKPASRPTAISPPIELIAIVSRSPIVAPRMPPTSAPSGIVPRAIHRPVAFTRPSRWSSVTA